MQLQEKVLPNEKSPQLSSKVTTPYDTDDSQSSNEQHTIAVKNIDHLVNGLEHKKRKQSTRGIELFQSKSLSSLKKAFRLKIATHEAKVDVKLTARRAVKVK